MQAHYIYLLILLTFLIIVQRKFLVLIDEPQKQRHKILENKNIPLSGGIYLFLALTMDSFYPIVNEILFTIILLPFLILGIYSDTKVDFSPKIRLLFQSILIFLMIIFLDLKINKTGIFFLEPLINNNMFNLIFTSFCVIVLLNGSNFCDGINCNVIGYYLIITLGIFFSDLIIPESYSIKKIIVIFSIFYLFNLFNKCFLGDNGVYVISIFMSIFIIKFININKDISPLLALNLLWYPAFENLFTILRRFVKRQVVQNADRQHLHTLIYEKLKHNYNISYANTLTGIILNIFMLIGVVISIYHYHSSKIQLMIIALNIIFYIALYLKLSVKKSSQK